MLEIEARILAFEVDELSGVYLKGCVSNWDLKRSTVAQGVR